MHWKYEIYYESSLIESHWEIANSSSHQLVPKHNNEGSQLAVRDYMRCATTSTGKRLLRIQSTESREGGEKWSSHASSSNNNTTSQRAQSSTTRAHIQTELLFHTYMSFSLSVPTECTWDSMGTDEK